MTFSTFTKSLDDARDVVAGDDRGKWDSIARCHEVSLHQGRLHFPQVANAGFEGLVLSPWAMGQACHKLGMPAAYLNRCPPHLRDANFNYWNAQQDKLRLIRSTDMEPDETWLVRSKGGIVRGILSPRYAKLDNKQLLDTLLPMLRHKAFKVGLLELSGEALHLRLVDPSIGRDVLPSDRLIVGIHIANSEVGLRAVTVDALVFRLVCTNGLIRKLNHKSLLRQRHIHVNETRFSGLLQDAIQEAIIVAAGFIEQMALSIKTPVPDPDKAIALLGELWNLPKSTVEMVKFTLMGEAQQNTLYGLVNALTQSAQRLGIEERVELETLSSVLIDTTSTTKADQHLRQRVLSPKQ